MATSQKSILFSMMILSVLSQEHGVSCGPFGYSALNTLCFYKDMDLSATFASSFTIDITDVYSLSLINFTPKNNDCLFPSLSIEYMMSGASTSLYVYAKDVDSNGNDYNYGGFKCYYKNYWYQCLNSYRLDALLSKWSKWTQDSSYIIMLSAGRDTNVKVTINCAKRPTTSPTPSPTSLPTISPTKSPTTSIPTTNPSISPSFYPTMAPTVTYYEMVRIDNASCVDLAAAVTIFDLITEHECILYCQSVPMEECRIVTFLEKVKHESDSRCLIYNKQCSVRVSNALYSTSVSYKMYNDQCVTHPTEWMDILKESCQSYVDYNWCLDGSANREVEEFVSFGQHGLNALDACCECGGGVNLFNDDIGMIMHSFSSNEYIEKEPNCKWMEIDQYKQQIRHWDNFIAYQLCNNIFNDCSPLINTETRRDTNYSVHFCDVHENSSFNGSDAYFIMLINSNGTKTDIYLNAEWFDASDIYLNADRLDFGECFERIGHFEQKSHGIFPCYFVNTLDPSFYPTLNPSINPTLIPSFSPTLLNVLNSTTNVVSSVNTTSPALKVWQITIIVICSIVVLLVIYFIVKVFGPSYICKNYKTFGKYTYVQPSAPQEPEEFKEEQEIASLATLNQQEECLMCCRIANAFNSCGHITYCMECAPKAAATYNNECPICRKKVTFRRIYNR
eukprot:485820_1